MRRRISGTFLFILTENCKKNPSKTARKSLIFILQANREWFEMRRILFYLEDRGKRFLRNVGESLPVCRVSRPRRQQSSFGPYIFKRLFSRAGNLKFEFFNL
jgi:hypothetical protein